MKMVQLYNYRQLGAALIVMSSFSRADRMVANSL